MKATKIIFLDKRCCHHRWLVVSCQHKKAQKTHTVTANLPGAVVKMAIFGGETMLANINQRAQPRATLQNITYLYRIVQITLASLLALARWHTYLPRDSASSVTPDKQTAGKTLSYIFYPSTQQALSLLFSLPSKLKTRPAAVQKLKYAPQGMKTVAFFCPKLKLQRQRLLGSCLSPSNHQSNGSFSSSLDFIVSRLSDSLRAITATHWTGYRNTEEIGV